MQPARRGCWRPSRRSDTRPRLRPRRARARGCGLPRLSSGCSPSAPGSARREFSAGRRSRTTATTAPSDSSGEELTDQATALLGQGRWAEAEAVSRQALAKLEGSGELYEAYANYNLGRALVEQDRCDEALPHLDRSEEIQGSRREIREARARCS